MWQPWDLKPGFLSSEVYYSFLLPDFKTEHPFWLTKLKETFLPKNKLKRRKVAFNRYSHNILELPTARHRVTNVNK